MRAVVTDGAYDGVRSMVRGVVAQYVGREFDDQEDFQSDLRLLSDDLTAIALEIEKKTGVRIDRKGYLNVHCVADLTQLIREHKIEPDLIAIIRRIGCITRPIPPSATIWHDLNISGDDADELLSDIARRFGTSFRAMNFGRYFPNEGEWVFSRWTMKLGWKDRQHVPVTVAHLQAVIERGEWFDPVVEKE